MSKKPTIVNYSSLGLQIVVVIGGMAYLGQVLDDHYQLNKNWITLGLVLFGTAASMWYTIYTLKKWDNRD
jgi:cobyric acid synthase